MATTSVMQLSKRKVQRNANFLFLNSSFIQKLEDLQKRNILESTYLGFNFNYAKMAQQHYLKQNFYPPFDLMFYDRYVNPSYKYQIESRPIGSMYSAIQESTRKQSLCLRVDLEESQVDS